MHRFLSAVAQAYYEARSCGQDLVVLERRRRSKCSNDHRSRDILWQAKRNAFRRALSDHDLTEEQACRVLVCLSKPKARGRGPGRGQDRGCELARLSSLTGLGPEVLDRVVPLMGLQSFVTVEERDLPGRPGTTTLWVYATGHGLRYTGEAGLPSSEQEAFEGSRRPAGVGEPGA